MKRRAILLLMLLLGYALSGVYVIRGNERGVIRRFGRVLTTDDGRVHLSASGLHIDLPWPLAKIDRINLNEIHTLSIGVAEQEDFAQGAFLQPVGNTRQSEFLTGDKNILNLQVNVQYRIAEESVEKYLFATESPRKRLRLLVEAVTTGLIARSGVDYVHPLGRAELRDLLTRRVRELTAAQEIGIDVEDVSINEVYPPVQVKADFLDVSNARADMARYINAARAYQQQRREAGISEASAIRNAAASDFDSTVESARAQADSFRRIIAQFRSESESSGRSYEDVRQMALRRHYLETVESILGRADSKVLLDSGKPVDLTIVRDPAK